jgi:hypothetical protein
MQKENRTGGDESKKERDKRNGGRSGKGKLKRSLPSDEQTVLGEPLTKRVNQEVVDDEAKEVAKTSGGVEEDLKEVKKKIEGVEEEKNEVTKKIEGIEAKTWSKPSDEEKAEFEGSEEFRKRSEKNKLQDILKGLQEEQNILLKQDGSGEGKKAVDSPASLLNVLETLFPNHPQPRTTTEQCISELNVNTPLLARNDQLTRLYSLWKDRMFCGRDLVPERMGHPVVALSCLPWGGKTLFLSHALKLPTFVDRLTKNDSKTWESFATCFRKSIRLFF